MHATLAFLGFFAILLYIGIFVLSIIMIVRWFKMTRQISDIHKKITHTNQQPTYLIVIGEKEQATKSALKQIVDKLYPIYNDIYCTNKAEQMNNIIIKYTPTIQRLGISLPEYLSSGEQFIDYLNILTGQEVKYSGTSNYSKNNYSNNNYFN